MIPESIVLTSHSRHRRTAPGHLTSNSRRLTPRRPMPSLSAPLSHNTSAHAGTPALTRGHLSIPSAPGILSRYAFPTLGKLSPRLAYGRRTANRLAVLSCSAPATTPACDRPRVTDGHTPPAPHRAPSQRRRLPSRPPRCPTRKAPRSRTRVRRRAPVRISGSSRRPSVRNKRKTTRGKWQFHDCTLFLLNLTIFNLKTEKGCYLR